MMPPGNPWKGLWNQHLLWCEFVCIYSHGTLWVKSEWVSLQFPLLGVHWLCLYFHKHNIPASEQTHPVANYEWRQQLVRLRSIQWQKEEQNNRGESFSIICSQWFPSSSSFSSFPWRSFMKLPSVVNKTNPKMLCGVHCKEGFFGKKKGRRKTFSARHVDDTRTHRIAFIVQSQYHSLLTTRQVCLYISGNRAKIKTVAGEDEKKKDRTKQNRFSSIIIDKSLPSNLAFSAIKHPPLELLLLIAFPGSDSQAGPEQIGKSLRKSFATNPTRANQRLFNQGPTISRPNQRWMYSQITPLIGTTGNSSRKVLLILENWETIIATLNVDSHQASTLFADFLETLHGIPIQWGGGTEWAQRRP